MSLPGVQLGSALINTESTRISSTSEAQYGLSEESTLKAKIDAGYVTNNYEVDVVHAGARSKYKYSSEYTSIISEFAYRQQIARDQNGVFSSSFSFFPGEFVITNNESYLISEQMSYEFRLLYGLAFDGDINLLNEYKGVGQTRFHYFEWQMGARHYPQLSQVQWEFDQHLGIRPIDNFLFVVSLYNTFHGASFIKRPYSQADLNNLANSTSLDSNQKQALINGIKSVLTQNSTYRDHKLNLKISYALEKDKNISLESFSNVLIQKPFTNNTIVLSYDVKF